ncbi:MAG: HAD family hydrolase [Gemmatimonadaceae bacterium]|nr:HAD family hydrolase [Gemmatimonadaceae bacterium]
MKVVLFDIDGTLLLSDGAGRTAMEAALERVFGHRGPSGYRYGGKTDKLIVRETMRLEGFDDAAIDARMEEVLARYLQGLRGHLESGTHSAHALPGVPELLSAIEARDDLVLGLLTGNIAEGAGVKLRAVGVEPARFRVAAYGSDHEDRPMLPPIAQRRASDLLGYDVPGERFVIIGDTPHDMTCGQGIGARAIAVSTGGYARAELVAHGAVADFEDLRDTTRVLEAILDA